MTRRRWSLPRSGHAKRLSRTDWIAIGLLIALPVLLYVPLSLAGHPVLPGDDLIQNYPLRVLSGSILRSGHLPLWNPLMWSGTPLLAGWNAGSLYPGTMLFALIPAVAAWTVNLVLVDVVAGIGFYVLLRSLNCFPFASLIGASCFTYTGFMSGQFAHIGLVQGSSYLPWMLLGIELLALGTSLRGAVLPMLLLALSTGLCILSGEPRAVSSAVIVCGLYAICRLLSLWGRRAMRAIEMMTAAAVLGAGLAAIQWVPGLTFIAASQRSLNAYSAFNAGSLSWSSLARDMLVPFLLGGNRNFGLPIYQGSYNLPEITVGSGLLPLIAAAWFLPEVTRRGIVVLRELDRRLGRASKASVRRTSEHVRPLGVWYAMALLGVALTLGGTTPLGRILVRIPLYGGERLQNRNAVIFDLALAVILAFFVNDFTAARITTQRVRDTKRRRVTSQRLRFVVIWVPIVGCLVVLAETRGNAIAVERRLGVVHPSVEFFARLAPYFGWTVALAFCIGIFLLMASRWSTRICTLALGLLAIADIGTYVANASFASVPSVALDQMNPDTQQLAALVGTHRVGLYNPLVLRPTPATASQALLGEPDLNVVQDVASIQGYGSIVSGAYQTATSTHYFEGLDLTVLRNGLENSLNLGVLLTLPTYLDVELQPHSSIPLAGGGALNDDGTPSSVVAPRAPLSSGPWTVTPDTSGTWWLPGVSALQQVTIVTTPAGRASPARLQIGLASPGKLTRHYDVTTTGRVAYLSLRGAVSADEISIKNLGASSVVVAALVVETRDPSSRLLLDGALQGWLPASQWSQTTNLGPFVAFVNEHALGAAWLQPQDSLAPTGEVSSIGVVHGIVAPQSGGQTMQIVAKRPALLIRSAAWAPGWKASITPSAGGPTRNVPVGQLGLVEAISVPAGASRVRWFYAPAGVIASGFVSLASGGVIIALFLVTLFRSRRRAKERAQLGPSADTGPEK